MKAKTLNLLNLIKSKKDEIRKEKRDKAFRKYAESHSHTLTEEEEREFKAMVREGQRLLEIDRRADKQLNKDVDKIHKQMFGY